MADKLSWTELRRALAVRAGVSEKKAGAFLQAFQVQLVEALKQDKQVKINGLGTFKLQSVAPRKSVNVKTGEEITIEGYNKLAFTPEAGVKELVESGKWKEESPAADPNDPIQKLGAQAEEIVDILGELGQRPGETVSGERLAVSEEPKEEPIQEPKEPKEPEKVEEPAFIPEAEPEPEPQPEPKPKKKKHHFVRDTLICVVILLMLLAGAYFFLRHELSSIIQSLIQPEQTEYVAPAPKEEEPVIETVVVEEPVVKEASVEEVAPVEDIRVYKDYILTEEITPGSRLAWIAKKHYGNKVYWPYLYDANKDHLRHPSQIAVGTPIRVPRLTEAQLDTTSAQFKQLRQEAEEACKK